MAVTVVEQRGRMACVGVGKVASGQVKHSVEGGRGGIGQELAYGGVGAPLLEGERLDIP
jgi:hypothetical protein